jgi:hypothetical protein
MEGCVVVCAICLVLLMFFSSKLWKSETASHSLPFFGFAVMMTEAGLIHTCNRYFNVFGRELFWFIDAALTSSIALAFGCIALQDIGKLKNDKSFFGWFVLLDLPVVLGWYYAFFVNYTAATQAAAFQILYFDLILVTCGFFGIVQVVYIVRGRFAGGLVFIILACAAGFVGLTIAISVCSWPDIRLSSEVWWFLLSDVSVFMVYKYFVKRKVEQ